MALNLFQISESIAHYNGNCAPKNGKRLPFLGPLKNYLASLKQFVMSTNHEILLQTAVDMTTLYRANKPVNFPICETFELEAINRLLSSPGCASLRIYYGMKADKQVDAILVAVNEAGEDILPNPALSATTDAVILEDSLRCPDDCPPKSPLNTDQ